MILLAEFFVPGIPVAKGSTRAFYNRKAGRAFVVPTNAKRQKPWVSMVSTVAQDIFHRPALGALQVEMVFHMPRPKKHFNSKRLLKPDAPIFHSSRPDIDKLERAVMDALTSIAWVDDSQVAVLMGSKLYDTDKFGVHVKVCDHND